MKLLRSVLRCVKSTLINTIPPYHYQSAYHVTYRPRGSSIFVVPHSHFLEMNPFTIQQVFRHCHILVTDVPYEKIDFDIQGLSTVGALARFIEVQGGNGSHLIQYTCLYMLILINVF